METFVKTIFGGVFIFIAGETILRLILLPAQELRKTLASISYLLLFNQAELTNAISNKEIALKIQDKSAEIISKSSGILFYFLAQIIFRLPSKANIFEASRLLNTIKYNTKEESKVVEDSTGYSAKKNNFALENVDAINKVGRLLKIKTTYQ